MNIMMHVGNKPYAHTHSSHQYAHTHSSHSNRLFVDGSVEESNLGDGCCVLCPFLQYFVEGQQDLAFESFFIKHSLLDFPMEADLVPSLTDIGKVQGSHRG